MWVYGHFVVTEGLGLHFRIQARGNPKPPILNSISEQQVLMLEYRKIENPQASHPKRLSLIPKHYVPILDIGLSRTRAMDQQRLCQALRMRIKKGPLTTMEEPATRIPASPVLQLTTEFPAVSHAVRKSNGNHVNRSTCNRTTAPRNPNPYTHMLQHSSA